MLHCWRLSDVFPLYKVWWSPALYTYSFAHHCPWGRADNAWVHSVRYDLWYLWLHHAQNELKYKADGLVSQHRKTSTNSVLTSGTAQKPTSGEAQLLPYSRHWRIRSKALKVELFKAPGSSVTPPCLVRGSRSLYHFCSCHPNRHELSRKTTWQCFLEEILMLLPWLWFM